MTFPRDMLLSSGQGRPRTATLIEERFQLLEALEKQIRKPSDGAGRALPHKASPRREEGLYDIIFHRPPTGDERARGSTLTDESDVKPQEPLVGTIEAVSCSPSPPGPERIAPGAAAGPFERSRPATVQGEARKLTATMDAPAHHLWVLRQKEQEAQAKGRSRNGTPRFVPRLSSPGRPLSARTPPRPSQLAATRPGSETHRESHHALSPAISGMAPSPMDAGGYLQPHSFFWARASPHVRDRSHQRPCHAPNPQQLANAADGDKSPALGLHGEAPPMRSSRRAWAVATRPVADTTTIVASLSRGRYEEHSGEPGDAECPGAHDKDVTYLQERGTSGAVAFRKRSIYGVDVGDLRAELAARRLEYQSSIHQAQQQPVPGPGHPPADPRRRSSVNPIAILSRGPRDASSVSEFVTSLHDSLRRSRTASARWQVVGHTLAVGMGQSAPDQRPGTSFSPMRAGKARTSTRQQERRRSEHGTH